MLETEQPKMGRLLGCHYSSVVIAVLFLVVWAIVTFPGIVVRNEVPLVEQGDDFNIEQGIVYYIHQHGWPFAHFERITARDFDEQLVDPEPDLAERAEKWLNEPTADRTSFSLIHCPIDADDLCRDPLRQTPIWKRSESWSHQGLATTIFPYALLANLVIGIAAFALVLGFFEWRRRNRKRVWQFSISDILLTITVVSLGLQFWISAEREFEREAELMSFTNTNWYAFRESNNAPVWLKKLVPIPKLKRFERIARFSQNGFWNDPDHNKAVQGFRQLKIMSSQPHPELLKVFSKTTVDTMEFQIYQYTDPLLLYKNSYDLSLGSIPNLKRVVLNGVFENEKLQATKFFDDLANAKRLSTIEFRSFTLDPAEIAALQNVGSLQRLNIIEGRLSGKLIAEIAKLKKLKILELRGTPIAENELAILRSALPNAKIFVVEVAQLPVDEANL